MSSSFAEQSECERQGGGKGRGKGTRERDRGIKSERRRQGIEIKITNFDFLPGMFSINLKGLVSRSAITLLQKGPPRPYPPPRSDRSIGLEKCTWFKGSLIILIQSHTVTRSSIVCDAARRCLPLIPCHFHCRRLSHSLNCASVPFVFFPLSPFPYPFLSSSLSLSPPLCLLRAHSLSPHPFCRISKLRYHLHYLQFSSASCVVPLFS